MKPIKNAQTKQKRDNKGRFLPAYNDRELAFISKSITYFEELFGNYSEDEGKRMMNYLAQRFGFTYWVN